MTIARPRGFDGVWGRWLISACGALLLSACGTMPGFKKTHVDETPVERVYAKPLELLQKTPPKVELVEKSVDVTIDEKSPVLKSEQKMMPGVTLRIVTRGKETPYLTLSSWFHSVGYGKAGVVIPRVYAFDEKRREVKIPMVQIGEEPNCGLMRCMRLSYDIASLPAGKYDLVLVSVVDDPETPFKFNRQSMVIYGGAAGMIYTDNEFPIYTDYLGSISAQFRKELPFRRK